MIYVRASTIFLLFDILLCNYWEAGSEEKVEMNEVVCTAEDSFLPFITLEITVSSPLLCLFESVNATGMGGGEGSQ